jgi:hypothetical protein
MHKPHTQHAQRVVSHHHNHSMIPRSCNLTSDSLYLPLWPSLFLLFPSLSFLLALTLPSATS